ncbi:MAG: DNA gyrase subunit A [Candidatus Thermoplasmatota archaeon]|nr:DNA gyrase subunit A [Candidatus Thermoplasmatota archaeon]
MQQKAIEEEIRKSYLEYAMSVIVNRAIPDVRDGLKPVQRRIIFAMNELSLSYGKPYKKSARIVGETMGKYHPHGDVALYDAMARMAQPFSLRYPLVDGQGNFGSLDGDEPAAMRYTEARLTEISDQMLEDIEKETVPMRLNFDGTLPEPEYLPSKVPQLLVNGTSGIAVGMATNLIPHNLTEVCSAIKHLVDEPNASTKDLMKFVKGPDFPGGSIVFFTDELVRAYETGRGKATVQADLDLSHEKKIIIRSIPYGVNKTSLIEKIASLVRDEVISGITDIRDESDRAGIRIVLRLREESSKPLIENQLLQHTELETSIGIINLVLVDNKPVTMSLKALMESFIAHRLTTILKSGNFDLSNNKRRDHLLSGISKAVDDIDNVISIIRKAKDTETARSGLMKMLEVSEDQANAILDIRLQRLTGLEREKLDADLREIRKEIERLTRIVESDSERRRILKEQMDDLIRKYGDNRRTKIVHKELLLRTEEELIPNEESLVVLSQQGFLKRVMLEEYRSQRRGGKGIAVTAWKYDPVRTIVSCDSHDSLLFFTSSGRVARKKAYEVEKRSRTANGIMGSAVLKLPENDVVRQIMKNPKNLESSIMIVTRRGKVKRVASKILVGMRSSGFRIISLNPGDEVVAVEEVAENERLFVLSSSGKAALFQSEQVREMGRAAAGVRAIRLVDDDFAVTAFPVAEGQQILSVSVRGIGKRTPVEDFSTHGRGVKGVMVFKPSERTGNIAACVPVVEDDEVLIISKGQKSIRIRAGDINVQSRITSGVRLMQIGEDDEVIQVTKL